MSISVNMIVTDVITGAEYLVLWISPDGTYGYWHNLSSPSRMPVKVITAEAEAGIADGRYETGVFAAPLRPEETLSIKEREYRDRRWDLIEHIVEREPEVYDNYHRIRLIREVSEKKNTTVSNLYKLLDRYWRSGKSKNGLLPLYSNCGVKGKPRKDNAEKGDAGVQTGRKKGNH